VEVSTGRHESSSHRQLLQHLDGYLLRHHAYVDDLFDVFTVSALPTFHDSSPHADLGYNELLGYTHKLSTSFFLINYFYSFNLFRRPALHVFLLFRSLPSTCSGAWQCQHVGHQT
jgi:hypothetical protein